MAGGTGNPDPSDPADQIEVALLSSWRSMVTTGSFPPNTTPPKPVQDGRDYWGSLFAGFLRNWWNTLPWLAPLPPIVINPPAAAMPSVATTDVQYGPHGYPRGIQA